MTGAASLNMNRNYVEAVLTEATKKGILAKPARLIAQIVRTVSDDMEEDDW